MPMTVEQIAKEAMLLERTDLLRLRDELNQLLGSEFSEVEIEKSWADEPMRRQTQIEKGEVTLIPWEQVNAEAKRALLGGERTGHTG